MAAELVQINKVKYDKELFEAWQMRCPLDGMFSIDGGIPKATNWMIVGDPGVGKCVHPNTLVKIKIDSTGEERTTTVKDLHELIKS